MMFNARRITVKQFAFSAFFVAAALAGGLHNAKGQAINAAVQTAAPRVVSNRSTPTTAAKPVGTARVAPQFVPRPTGLSPQRFNANLPRTIGQPEINPQRSYSPTVRSSNPTFAAWNMQRHTTGQRAITLDPTTRQAELRTLAAMHQRRGIVNREGNVLDPATRQSEMHTLAAMRER